MDANVKQLVKETAALLNLRVEWGAPITVGDDYIGVRDGRACVLTAKEVHPTWVEPSRPAAYCYDLTDCVKVTRHG